MVGKFKNIIKKNAVDTQEMLFVQPIKEFEPKLKKQIPITSVENTFDMPKEDDETVQTEMFIAEDEAVTQKEADETQASTSEDHYNQLREDAKQQVDIELEAYKNQKKQEFDNELEELKKKTLEEAKEEGRKEGLAEYQEKSEELMNNINDIVVFRNKALFYFEPFLIDLATAISGRIIDQQVKLDTAVFRKMFVEALNNITDKEKIVIQVNPEDVQEIEAYQEEFPKKFQEFKQIEIQEEPSMQRGGCTIETKLGYIDGSIETKLSLLKETMKELFDEEKERLGEDAVLIPDEETVNAIEVPEMPVLDEPAEAELNEPEQSSTEEVTEEITEEIADVVYEEQQSRALAEDFSQEQVDIPIDSKLDHSAEEIVEGLTYTQDMPLTDYDDMAVDEDMLSDTEEGAIEELMEDVDADVFDQEPLVQVNESDITDSAADNIDPNLKADDIFLDKTDEMPITEEQLEKDFEDFDFDEDFS